MSVKSTANCLLRGFLLCWHQRVCIHHIQLHLYIIILSECPNGKCVAEIANPAVAESLLEEIWCMRSHDVSWKDIIQRLRTSTVPSGYTFSTWKPGLGCYKWWLLIILHTHVGISESFEDQMRSILAQLEYKHTIKKYEEEGVPFRTYMYVPEVHPATNARFYEREDDAHLLKVKYLFC